MSYSDIEREISKRFDDEVAPFVLEVYDADDTITFNEEFNNWLDMLNRDGEVSDDVAHNVCYVGKYSGDK